MSKPYAHGVTTVVSTTRPECHAPSGYTVRDFSAKPASTGISPRDRQRDMILAFWESQGVARWAPTKDEHGKFNGARWEVRDVLNSEASGMWFPLATQGEDMRADMCVFSHMRSAANCGAWCACNIVPEVGAFNHARGEMDAPLTPSARALLAAWPAWWAKHYARPASLARLGR